MDTKHLYKISVINALKLKLERQDRLLEILQTVCDTLFYPPRLHKPHMSLLTLIGLT